MFNSRTSSAFPSYSREDSEFTLRLAQNLNAVGTSAWLDQLDIPPGQLWDDAIEGALTAVQYILLALSPSQRVPRTFAMK